MTTRGDSVIWARVALATAVLSLPVHPSVWAVGTPLSVGGYSAGWQLEVQSFYTDNVYHQESNETELAALKVRPAAAIGRSAGAFNIMATANADLVWFDVAGTTSDYQDYTLGLDLDWFAERRNRFDLSLTRHDSHDAFGLGRQQSGPVGNQDYDRWYMNKGTLSYRHGAPGATVNTKLSVGASGKRYTTNEAQTRFIEYDTTTAGYEIFYRFSPKTFGLIDATRDRVTFEETLPGGVSRDATELNLRIGTRWLATAKTSGDVRVGYRQREFDSGARAVRRLGWSAGVDWSPVQRTSVRLTSESVSQETYLVATSRVIDVQKVALGVSHELTTRLKSSASVMYTNSEFVGTSPREDDWWSASLSGEYVVLRNVILTAGGRWQERDSTVATRDFQEAQAFLGFRIVP